jgi:alkylhydroperoxidase family enzyme
VKAVLADYRTAAISPQVKAMCAYLEKMTLTPEALTVADARELKAAGVSKEAAQDALFVAFCFNQIVRIADALDWEISSPEGFAAGARSLLKFGYVLPFHSKPKKQGVS